MPTSPFTLAELEPTRRPALQAAMLPPRAFTDPAVADWEEERLFLGGWMCVGHAGRVGTRGEFVTREVAGESLLFVADEQGTPRGFHNVCRHRAARLVDEREGRVGRLQCPYHAWSYALDGSLRNAPHTNEVEDFEPSCYGLAPLRTAVVEGLLFCDASGVAPPLEEHIGDVGEHLARYRLQTLRRSSAITYDVAANWKAIAENYSECLHCPGVHPELNRLSHYLSGQELEGKGAWCGGTMTMREGAATMAVDGGASRRPPIAALDDQERRSVLYLALFPNALISLHPDYAMLHTLWPRGPERTEVLCEWYFEPETMAQPGFDDSDAVRFWDQVNREDWRVCELSQLGIGSRGYTRGRYTDQESSVHAFDRMVADAYAADAD